MSTSRETPCIVFNIDVQKGGHTNFHPFSNRNSSETHSDLTWTKAEVPLAPVPMVADRGVPLIHQWSFLPASIPMQTVLAVWTTLPRIITKQVSFAPSYFWTRQHETHFLHIVYLHRLSINGSWRWLLKKMLYFQLDFFIQKILKSLHRYSVFQHTFGSRCEQ